MVEIIVQTLGKLHIYVYRVSFSPELKKLCRILNEFYSPPNAYLKRLHSLSEDSITQTDSPS